MQISASDRSALLGIMERFPRQRIVLVGDLVADEFILGEIARVSREAPVLILKQRSKQILPGGGANAASNLADLGARVTPVGVVGDDEAGEALLGCFRDKGVSTRQVVRLRGHVTPTKSRVLGVLSHGRPQPIGDNLELLDRLGMKMLRRQSLQALVITRGREGMVVFEPRQKPRRLPVFGSDQVADVTGAGDTVVAAFTLALAAGASFVHAAMLANCAGGLVVMKSGTATVTRRALEEDIRNA